MPGNACLARLIKDHGGMWVREHTGPGEAWVAIRRDGEDIRILDAHDVGGLRHQIEQTERDDAGQQGAG